MKTKNIKSITAFVCVCAFATFLSSCGSGGCSAAQNVKEKNKNAINSKTSDLKLAPALAVEGWVQGPEIQVTTGVVTVVEFWATFCPPCQFSIPHLNELYIKHKDDGLRIVGIASERPHVVRAFIAEQGDKMTYPIAVGSGDDFTNYFGDVDKIGIPYAFVIGKDMRIIWEGTPLDPEFDAAIKKALDKKAADNVE